MKLIGALLVACGALSAQNQAPTYRFTMTSRTVKAISYQHRSGATNIDFLGTDLLASGHGVARVGSRQGHIRIEAEFDGLQPATNYGAEYLTYVMWAITPEGRTANLSEVLLDGTKSKLDVTTDLQVFGLVVTAEPYYAVTRPSDLIVMQNVVRPDTVGKIEEIDAKYELLQRGQYRHLSNPLALKLDRKVPIDLYEARNAVEIARAEGADRFAGETFQKAEKSLAEAEAYQARNAGRKPVEMAAREAVQTAEDARTIAVKRQDDQALAADRQGLVDRGTRAENGLAAAQSENDRVTQQAEAARLRAQAEAQRLTSEKDAQASASLTEADRVKRENDARMTAAADDASRLKIANDARMNAAADDASRLKIANDARMTAAADDASRLKIANDAQMAAAAGDADRLKVANDARAMAATTEADRLKQENDAQRAASQIELDSAAKQTAQLQADKVELRIQLLSQFNAILQTRDTDRGLVVNMSDVLFDSAKYTLRAQAREKLAKLAGIVSGHPGLKLDVQGYTDSIGGDDYNQQLSEQRSQSVRGYLTQQGMPLSSVTAEGFGKTQPIASNDTADGRQQNRRVEIVISGEIIGTVIGAAK
jgi:outer membrane protein OmpA-like peptidoglycan-associated protein